MKGDTCALDRDSDSGKRLIALSDRLSPLMGIQSGSEIGPLYDRGVIPLDSVEINGFGGWIRAACEASLDSATLSGQISEAESRARTLANDPVRPLLDATREAIRIVEQTYQITAVDLGGVTTTLQRYAQLDVVNAYFVDQEQVRLLATFSFYPGATTFGGETQPQTIEDRLVISLGYSLANIVENSESSQSGENGSANQSEQMAFTLGLSYRFTPTLSLGGGLAVLEGGDMDGYVSFSFDLGGIPFLKELFARLPSE